MVDGEQRLGASSGDVVGEELHDAKHGKSAVLDLAVTHVVIRLRSIVSAVEGSDRLVRDLLPHDLLKKPDKGDKLKPSQHRDLSDSRHTVADIRELQSINWGDIAADAEVLLSKVSNHSELRHAAVLELGSSILVKLLLGDTIGKAKRIPEPHRVQHT